MNSRRTPTRRIEENDVHEEIPPQVDEIEKVPQGFEGDQVPIIGGGNDVLVVPAELSNSDIRKSLLDLYRAVTTQVNLSIVTRVNGVYRTMKSRVIDFVRINPPIFLGSKVGEDPQVILDGVYKVLSDMGITSSKKGELTSY